MITTTQHSNSSSTLPTADLGDVDAYELVGLRRPDVNALLADVARGDRRAWLILDSFNRLVRKVNLAPRYSPAACFCCARPVFGNRFVGAIALPLGIEPGSRLHTMLLCEPCAPNARNLRERATKAFRAKWPSLRLVEPTHAGGRA